MEAMERWGIDPLRWEEMGQSEEGQYAQAEMMEYVAEKSQMVAWERYDQEQEYNSKHPPKGRR